MKTENLKAKFNEIANNYYNGNKAALIEGMTEFERIECLKYIIQRNYDDDNWYGRDSNWDKRELATTACQVELLGKGIVFHPKYNCPA